ncbi:hypothetical protein MesoLjLc_21300 [Mesorhizobium sp. L-8-10]|uniref:hypothetical protein n=1 Tax=Mesorhizobium sp. L-8-10 TaxID=2744523 RepID=UPI0019285357|nr:hypothetical protein [Mesorhizobium sp. L-8-10]BCH30200.1 hypothetical protein MesoLjLc_21300 [Mesorhizobium sp. L-8-10]
MGAPTGRGPSISGRLESCQDSARIHQSLIADSLARQDTAGAIEDYARYQRALNGRTPFLSPALMALIRPLPGAQG